MKNIKIIITSVMFMLCFFSSVIANAALPPDAQAFMLSKQGNYSQAIKIINQAILSDSKNYSYYNTRAVIKENAGDITGAIADYTKAIQLNANYYNAYSNRANLYIKTEKYNLAIQDCNKLVQINPSYISYETSGHLKLDMAEYNGAINDFTKAISFIQQEKNAFNKKVAEGSAFGTLDMSRFEGVYYGRGIAYFNTKNYDKAKYDFDTAIKCRNFNPDAYYFRGVIKGIKGYKQDALKDLNIAKQQYQQEGNQSGYLNTVQIINKL